MKLSKAIEILDDLKDSGIDAGHYDAEDAIQLGIEALKMINEGRSKPGDMFFHDLPGESES